MTLDYRHFWSVFTLLLAGCAMPATGPLKASFESASPSEALPIDPTFEPAMNAIVEDQPRTGGMWETDDWILLGVKVTHEKGQDVWLVRLTTLKPEDPAMIPDAREFIVPYGIGPVKTASKFNAPIGKILVESFDHLGEPLRSSVRTIPHLQPQSTLLDLLASTSEPHAIPTAVPLATQPNAQPTAGPAPSRDDMMHAITMIELMSGARALVPIRDSIRDHVIHKPSIVAVVMNGFRLNLEARIERHHSFHLSHISPAIVKSEEARFPLYLAGHRLFDCRVIAGPTDTPFHLIAGALMVEAVNPEKPNNRLTVCVLAAKRGVMSADQVATKK